MGGRGGQGIFIGNYAGGDRSCLNFAFYQFGRFFAAWFGKISISVLTSFLTNVIKCPTLNLVSPQNTTISLIHDKTSLCLGFGKIMSVYRFPSLRSRHAPGRKKKANTNMVQPTISLVSHIIRFRFRTWQLISHGKGSDK